MALTVPSYINEGLDAALFALGGFRSIKGYRWLIGDPPGAHLPEFDDSAWAYSEGAVPLKRHQGVTWYRFTVKAPGDIMGLSAQGRPFRLTTLFFGPMDIYVNGELKLSERSWVDFKSPELVLTESAAEGEGFHVAAKLTLLDKSYWNWSFGMGVASDAAEDAEFEIASFKEELKFACRFHEVTHILRDVFSLLSRSLEDKGNIPGLLDAVATGREMLRPMETETKKRVVRLVGHAHIDVNWFWSMEETIDLVKRDFGTMIRLMGEFKDFKFSQSQCALYQIAEEHFPDLFEDIRKHVKRGNWDITASAWVENDMNMSSGEAVARHILYSKKYLKEKFGFEPRIMWCPDTFGHSANIPQILKKAGVDYYFFLRCGFGVNGTEYDNDSYLRAAAHMPLFWWEGLDGSRVLAYNMLYNSEMAASSVLDFSNRLADSYGLDEAMVVYGTGDHGGGPTKRDIRKVLRMQDWPTMPRIEFSTAHEYFSSVEAKHPSTIPVWNQELNFIFDGCYTTHADIKKYNRLCENALVRSEAAGVMAAVHGFALDRRAMEDCWKTTLVNQFHDILCGSGVPVTYQYSDAAAQQTLARLAGIERNAALFIGSMAGATRHGIPVILTNTTGWTRGECVKVRMPCGSAAHYHAVDAQGNCLPSQAYGEFLYIFVQEIPPMGYKMVYLMEGACEQPYERIREDGTYYSVETEYYKIEIRKVSGEITALYDKANARYVARRETIGWRQKNGVLNTLQIHNEQPIPMSSWTIGPAKSVVNLIDGAKAAIKADGPVVRVIGFEHKYGSSAISQDIVIYNNHPRIDFETHVQWQEYGDAGREAPMLKAVFTPDVVCCNAAYEIPFGAVERPCKDMEVPALKWMDISDGENGFALLNDCKHGHKARGNSLELTLIRSGWLPDPKSDVGKHDFTYSILPHAGSWRDAGVVKEGFCLNNRITAEAVEGNEAQGGAAQGKARALPEAFSYARLDCENVVLSAFKPAEAGDGLILRAYESAGRPCKAEASFGFGVAAVSETDLNESELRQIKVAGGNSFQFELNSYEIKTFKITRNGEIV